MYSRQPLAALKFQSAQLGYLFIQRSCQLLHYQKLNSLGAATTLAHDQLARRDLSALPVSHGHSGSTGADG